MMGPSVRATLLSAASLAILSSTVTAQTFSSCNPVNGGQCPPNPALGRSVAVDFTKGASDLFTNQGTPTYDSNGANFAVAKSGDAPQINSKFYIMFGQLEITMKAAPGVGVVSSVVLQSDCLDEIDWEWLGGNNDQVQSNYFGKGLTTSYNRGAFHPNPGNQNSFKTYTIDWTADQIVWQIDGSTVRALPVAQAVQGQYPQTPMQVKVGSWSGGDSANAPGTIQWAGGPTNYAAGPFVMQVKSLKVTDYSTGTTYAYNGQAGTWQSIVANGGSVNPKGGSGGSSPIKAAAAPAVTSASPGIPYPFPGTPRDSASDYKTPSIYPWVAAPTTLQSVKAASSTLLPFLPAGWTVSDTGRAIPPSSAPVSKPFPYPPSDITSEQTR